MADPSPSPQPSIPVGSFDNVPSSTTANATPTNPTPGVAASPATTTTTSAGIPDAFRLWITTIITSRLGSTKANLISDADKEALVEKIWADPTIQSTWSTNSSAMASSNVQTASTAAGIVGNAINNVMGGQGNDGTIAIDYTNMIQSAGLSLTTAELASLSTATQAVGMPVPAPFDTSKVSGYDFQAKMPATVGGKAVSPFQAGTDYGTPAGSRIVSPFAGTVHVALNVDSYGNIVYVQLDNGWTMGFAHVASGVPATGSRVNPGDLIAISGANVGDSTGAVTEVTWQDPSAKFDSSGVLQGGYQNPHQVLDQIFNGTTFSTIGLPDAAGTGMPTVNTKLDTEYPSIKKDWTDYFGSPPSPGDVALVLQNGTSPTEWTSFIRSLPGHIPGMNVGQITDLRTLADTASTKYFGHLATDGIVKELNDQGMVGQSDVNFFYGQLSENQLAGIDKQTYAQIAKVLEPNMKGALNETGTDPRMVKAIYDTQAGQVPHPGPQS